MYDGKLAREKGQIGIKYNVEVFIAEICDIRHLVSIVLVRGLRGRFQLGEVPARAGDGLILGIPLTKLHDRSQ